MIVMNIHIKERGRIEINKFVFFTMYFLFQVLLMKRQITEIEREIVERSSRQAVNVNGKVNCAEEKTDLKKNSSSIIDPADIDLECLDPLSKSFATYLAIRFYKGV